MLKLRKIHIFAILSIILLLVTFGVAYHQIFGSKLPNKETNKEETSPDNVARYRSTKSGVGFVLNNPSDLHEDLDKADKIGLVFLNAPYERNGEIPSIIKLGFEFTDLPVPNMAGSANDPEGLKKAYLSLVKDYNPVYIGLGNELERMQDVEAFIPVYNEIYEQLKRECSECLIYPTFQYESFDPSLVRRLKVDLLVLTSYPFAKYADLREIPQDYYEKAFNLAEELDVGIAFSEIGWTALPAYMSGYKDAQAAQVAFYDHFSALIKEEGEKFGVEVAFVSWGLLYDAPQVGKEWAGMGLYSNDGIAKTSLIDRLSGFKH